MKNTGARISFILILLQVMLAVSSAGKCGRSPVDVIFVLDESGSIWGPDFRKQLQFVQDLVDGFDFGPNGTRIGVETFGTDVRTVIQLGESNDPTLIKRRIEAVQQRRGSTGTHLALQRLREMFAKSYARPGASRVAIVITDGESDNPRLTALEATGVHDDGIVVIAIGVGQSVKRSELESIASQSDFVFTVENYNDLNSLLSILAIKACPEEETPSPPPATKSTTWPPPAPATRTEEWKIWTKAPEAPSTTAKRFSLQPPQPKTVEGCDEISIFDIYFGLPDQLSALDSYQALWLIRNLTLLLGETPSRIRPRLCPRLCPAGCMAQSQDTIYYPGQSDFLVELERRWAETSTRYDLMTQYIRKQEEENRRRCTASEDALRSAIAIMLLDNRLANLERTMREMERARTDGIHFVFVGVGDKVDENELAKLTRSERDLVYIPSYSHLPKVTDVLLERVCIRGLIQSARDSAKRTTWE